MRLLEILFVLIVLSLLIVQLVRGIERRHAIALFSAGLLIVLLSAFFDQMRWQMAPAYLLFVAVSLLLLRRSYSHVAVRSIGAVVGVLFLIASVALSVGLPVLELPAPDGPYIVGSTSVPLIDESRDNSFFGAPEEDRELFLQVWYPGIILEGETEPRVRTLWEELYRGDLDRFTLFTRYLRAIETHSYERTPLSPEQTTYPIIFFSHAMVSFAEQNTLLMEHLASHGYIVVGIGHTYTSMRIVSAEGTAIYPNLDRVNELSAQRRAVDDEIMPQIERAGNLGARARLQVERYERASGMNELMAIWVDDLRFVLNAITADTGRYPELQAFASRIDLDQIGFLGMSFGGGAITDLCKVDNRCRAAVNMDGDTFGQHQRQPLEIPYMALVREGQRSLEYLMLSSRNDYYEVEVDGTTHLDFTDDTFVLPVLKWFNVTGSVSGARVIEVTNEVVRQFFDAYLRRAPKPRFNGEFPELTVEGNSYALE
jgi:predicted dienelactone hydrolase